MHIGDGLFPTWQALLYFILVIPIYIKAVKWMKNELKDEQIPLLATLAAGVFATQALNIPIPWGTSGHLIGATLCSILFGTPFAGFIVLLMVLIIQAFVFLDGGVLALGVNTFNMGVIASFSGYYVYTFLKSITGNDLAVFLAAWLSVILTSVACSFELYFAGIFPLMQSLTLMVTYHIFIGVLAEAWITLLVFKGLKDHSSVELPAFMGDVVNGE